MAKNPFTMNAEDAVRVEAEWVAWEAKIQAATINPFTMDAEEADDPFTMDTEEAARIEARWAAWEASIKCWPVSLSLAKRREYVTSNVQAASIPPTMKEAMLDEIASSNMNNLYDIEKTLWDLDIKRVEAAAETKEDVIYTNWLECSRCFEWHKVSAEEATAFSAEAIWHCPSCLFKK